LELAGLHRLSIEQNWIFPNYFRLAFHVLFNVALMRYGFIDCPPLQAWILYNPFVGWCLFTSILGFVCAIPGLVVLVTGMVRLIGSVLYYSCKQGCNRRSLNDVMSGIISHRPCLERLMGGKPFKEMEFLGLMWVPVCLAFMPVTSEDFHVTEISSEMLATPVFRMPVTAFEGLYPRIFLFCCLAVMFVRHKITALLRRQVQNNRYGSQNLLNVFFPESLPLASKKFRAFLWRHCSTLGIMLLVGLNDIVYGLMLMHQISAMILDSDGLDEVDDRALFGLLGISFILKLVVMIALNRRCRQRNPEHENVYPGPWPARILLEFVEVGLERLHVFLCSSRQIQRRAASESELDGSRGRATSHERSPMESTSLLRPAGIRSTGSVPPRAESYLASDSLGVGPERSEVDRRSSYGSLGSHDPITGQPYVAGRPLIPSRDSDSEASTGSERSSAVPRVSMATTAQFSAGVGVIRSSDRTDRPSDVAEGGRSKRVDSGWSEPVSDVSAVESVGTGSTLTSGRSRHSFGGGFFIRYESNGSLTSSEAGTVYSSSSHS
jgi:hypothetical protein